MTDLFKEKSLILAIDAQSVAYRGFFAFKRRPLRNRKGQNTSAVFYFDRLLRDFLKKISPTHAVVGFDTKEPTFRHEVFNLYKAQRPETPEDFIPQVEWIKKICEGWGVKTVGVPGYEADDILAWASHLAKENKIPAVLVSSDKDLMALVDDYVRVYNVSDDRIYDREAVLKKFGLLPEQIPDYLIMVGDPTDNIPGIKNIGGKTARALLKRYGSLKNVLANLKEVESQFPRAARSLKEAVESGLVDMLYELVSLSFKPFFTLEDIRLGKPRRETLVEIYRELDFYSALKGIAVKPEIPDEKPCSFEGVKGVFFNGKNHTLSDGKWVYVCGDLPEWELYTVDLKSQLKAGGPLKKQHDLSVVDYLLQSEIEEEVKKNRHDLEFLALKYMAWKVPEDVERFVPYLSARIGESMMEELKSEGLDGIYSEIERPLIKVLADMEMRGVKVDVERLKSLSRELEVEISRVREEIFNLAGERFNLNSHKQLARILFDKLGLPPLKKRKTGYSTDVEVLTELSKLHPLPALILRYRDIFKVKSTYVDGLLKYVSDDGRIHPTFSQTTTATGRLACYDPNLQNIPVRGEWGAKIREVFIPEEGFFFADYDYSQIELRILAHLSDDENLKEIFRRGGDVHAETAKTLFGTDDITPEMRRVAKAVNFGIVYGISPFGLSRATGMDVEDAKEMIRRYYERFPNVKRWQEEVVRAAREKGYVETLFGRRRYIYGDPVKDETWRRIAINTPVQGSAADMIKAAMVRVHSHLRGRGAYLILQVHDELLFEVAQGEMEIVGHIKELMENTVRLSLPVVVDYATGRNWAEAHP